MLEEVYNGGDAPPIREVLPQAAAGLPAKGRRGRRKAAGPEAAPLADMALS
jgi:hypothetical protein